MFCPMNCTVDRITTSDVITVSSDSSVKAAATAPNASSDKYPYVSLLALGAVAAAFTLLSLDTVITSLVVIRSTVQFMGQNIGLYLLRRNRPDLPMPFRMWLYP